MRSEVDRLHLLHDDGETLRLAAGCQVPCARNLVGSDDARPRCNEGRGAAANGANGQTQGAEGNWISGKTAERCN